MDEIAHRHSAKIEWERRGAQFVDLKYSRVHRWHFDGGAVVTGSAAPSVVKVPYTSEEAVDPEEALVASLASCHGMWFLSIAAKHGIVIDRYEDDAEGQLGELSDGRIALKTIRLRPKMWIADPGVTSDMVKEIHAEAHRVCFIANTLISRIEINPTIVR